MKNIGRLVLLFLLFLHPPLFAAEEAVDAEQQQFIDWARGIWDSLDRQQGKVKLPNGVATLEVPDNFYYLKPADAEKVLVEVWGNPPGAGNETLGMLFPAEATPFDEGAWGVTIEYEEDGYVSDKDADDIDYDELLVDMKKGTREASQQRVAQGYEPIELVGWAAEPFYDKASHKLHWAKEIEFGGHPDHTLNYNIRVLGRKGVLVLNFIAGMEQKQLIDSRIDDVLALAEFDQGSRYEDFDPDIDQVAAYGIGALVAGKVAAKAGLFAAALVFLKKFGVLIVIGVGALLGRLLKRKSA
jgi:uncharacterized membrane-anchored protein